MYDFIVFMVTLGTVCYLIGTWFDASERRRAEREWLVLSGIIKPRPPRDPAIQKLVDHFWGIVILVLIALVFGAINAAKAATDLPDMTGTHSKPTAKPAEGYRPVPLRDMLDNPAFIKQPLPRDDPRYWPSSTPPIHDDPRYQPPSLSEHVGEWFERFWDEHQRLQPKRRQD